MTLPGIFPIFTGEAGGSGAVLDGPITFTLELQTDISFTLLDNDSITFTVKDCD